jgi:membrane protein implicated in regulation of membrane protease activity
MQWLFLALGVMQWAFLVLAVVAALIELHTGTFYLAAVATAALLTTVIGFWIRDDLLILVFLVLCAILIGAIVVWRRARTQSNALADFDIGQSVTIRSVAQRGNHLVVTYRGANWDAVMDDGSARAPGDIAVIKRKTDKLLHLASPREAART